MGDPRRSRVGSAAAVALVAAMAAACGSAKGAATAGASKGGAAATSSVTLAPGASPLCSKPPASGPLVTALTTDQSTWTSPSSATGLSPVMFNQPGQDGWSTPGTEGGQPAIQVIPGQNTSGTNFTYSELYFTSGGAVPASVGNVMLCLEYYDGTPGAVIALQYSGTNTSGPVNGAYDAAPETYTTKGTNKWLVGSFTMTGINFGAGDAGQGAENGGSDFRVTGENATPFWVDKAWLVIQNVPAKQALAAMPSAASATG